MNIKITHSWLADYLDTDATPVEIQKYLSLCGPSVERIEEVDGEVVYDIEITSNRIDTASVMGIAREAAAILPMFGKKAILKLKAESLKLKVENIMLKAERQKLKAPISITDPDGVCRRLLGIVMEVNGVEPSPTYMSKRVLATDTRSINNLVDITNYVMTEIGHPCHVFDYDRISTHTLILRHAKKGEEIITLDEKTYHLDDTDIIIDDGTGKVIDLPGIMGTANSVVTNETKRILFFIESNDPVAIRRTSMRYGIRTMASTINEKNPDSELAYAAFLRGIELYAEIAQGKVISQLVDIYPHKPQPVLINTSKAFIDTKAGVKIPLSTITSILTNLDFKVEVKNDDQLTIIVPTHRLADVSIPEDIVEEVTRVFGYFAIPSQLQIPAYVTQPKETEQLFHYQYEVKSLLKHRGLTEVMNYSACSASLLSAFGQKEKDYLHITNSISEDIKFLRQSLIPSLVQNIKQNEGFAHEMRLFEIAKTYIPVVAHLKNERTNGYTRSDLNHEEYIPTKNVLPREEFMLTVAVNTSFDDLKQTMSTLMDDLNILASLEQGTGSTFLLHKVQGEIKNGKETFGFYGQVTPEFCRNLGIEKPIYAAELYFERLMTAARKMPIYKAFSQYAHISNDITVKKTKSFGDMKRAALAASKHLYSFELLTTYKDTITLRLGFTNTTRNITEEEVKEEVKKIQNKISNFK